MPHVVFEESDHLHPRVKRTGRKNSPRSKQANSTQIQFDEIQDLFKVSALANSLASSLNARLSTSRRPITRAVSLGLGSFTEHSKDQSRRLKQLAIFTYIVNHVNTANLVTGNPILEVYAQDPSFTKSDSIFLSSLGVQVIKTPSPSELGQAQYIIDTNTLIYSPFLTIEAYDALFASSPVATLIGDDFQALKRKFDRGTDDHKSVELLSRSYLAPMRRRAIAGEGFWDLKSDKPFPLALYWRGDVSRRDSKL